MVSSDETLAATIKKLSHASLHDNKTSSPSVTQKWKKKERYAKTQPRPIQTRREIAGEKLVQQKRQRHVSKEDGTTGSRKQSKDQANNPSCIVVEAESQPCQAQ